MSSEARTSPEIEALELKLAAGEDQANLGTVMKIEESESEISLGDP